MKITGLRTSLVRIPLKTPTRFSTRTLTDREYVLVWVTTDEGAEGWGYTYAGTSGGQWVRQAIDELIGPCLLGRDALAFADNWELVFREFVLLGRRGGFIRALSAVDIAAWDLLGQVTGLPLRKLLGGTRSEIPAYASGGYYRPGDAIQNVVDEVDRYKRLGFADFKIKVGGLPLEQDVARVRAARETIGKTGRLALDANNAWRHVTDATHAIEAFAPYDIWWVEEPLMPDDVDGHAALSQRSPVPIATGEIEATRWGFARIMQAHAAHILQPDVGVAGGVTEWIKIAHTASTFDLPIAPHWHANLHAQLAAATPNCIAVEYFALDEGIYNFEALVAHPLTVSEGRLLLNDTPGIGVTVDDAKLAKYLVPDRG